MAKIANNWHNFLKSTYSYKSLFNKAIDGLSWPYRYWFGSVNFEMDDNNRVKAGDCTASSPNILKAVASMLLLPLTVVALPLKWMQWHFAVNKQDVNEEFKRFDRAEKFAVKIKNRLKDIDTTPTELKDYRKKHDKLYDQIALLKGEFKTKEDWHDSKKQEKFSILFMASMESLWRLFPYVQQQMQKDGLDQTEFGWALCDYYKNDQGQWSRRPYFFTTLYFYAAFINLYYMAREKYTYRENPNYDPEKMSIDEQFLRNNTAQRSGDTNQPEQTGPSSVRSEAPEFYQAGTIQNRWRITYNTFYDTFFETYCPREKIVDERLRRWTQPDPNDNDRFDHCPDTRPGA